MTDDQASYLMEQHHLREEDEPVCERDDSNDDREYEADRDRGVFDHPDLTASPLPPDPMAEFTCEREVRQAHEFQVQAACAFLFPPRRPQLSQEARAVLGMIPSRQRGRQRATRTATVPTTPAPKTGDQ